LRKRQANASQHSICSLHLTFASERRWLKRVHATKRRKVEVDPDMQFTNIKTIHASQKAAERKRCSFDKGAVDTVSDGCGLEAEDGKTEHTSEAGKEGRGSGRGRVRV